MARAKTPEEMERLREAARNAPRPSSEELEFRDRLRKRWIENHPTFDHIVADWHNDEFSFNYWRTARSWTGGGKPRGAWTTKRMFDGKFWSMQFMYRQSGEYAGQYVLMKSTVRYHAKRKDAKARAGALSGYAEPL